MKSSTNNQPIDKTPVQGPVAMKTSKETLAQMNEERWLSKPNKSLKSQAHELGRHKRAW